MVKNLKTIGGSDHVELKWDRPEYDPAKYDFTYSCKLIANGVEYIPRFTQTLESNATVCSVHNLTLDVACSLTLLAVYNPVSIDPGITVIAKTLAGLQR